MTAVLLDNHPNDSRVLIREDGIVQALTSRCGTGGGNVPMVMLIYDRADSLGIESEPRNDN